MKHYFLLLAAICLIAGCSELFSLNSVIAAIGGIDLIFLSIVLARAWYKERRMSRIMNEWYERTA